MNVDTCCALVAASFLEVQFLDTSAHLGETIQAMLLDLQIRKPPAAFGMKPKHAVVSKDSIRHIVELLIVIDVPNPKN